MTMTLPVDDVDGGLFLMCRMDGLVFDVVRACVICDFKGHTSENLCDRIRV